MSQSNQPQNSPYKVNTTPAGVRWFETKFNTQYFVAFVDITNSLSPMLGVYDIRVSEFQFHHYITKNALRGGHDEQVKPTLISLIREYFEDPEERVLAYVCDSSDGRAAERARLFSQWHEELADIADGHEIEVAIGDEKIYGGLFIPKKRQYGKVIQEYLIDEAGQIIVQKFGL